MDASLTLLMVNNYDYYSGNTTVGLRVKCVKYGRKVLELKILVVGTQCSNYFSLTLMTITAVLTE